MNIEDVKTVLKHMLCSDCDIASCIKEIALNQYVSITRMQEKNPDVLMKMGNYFIGTFDYGYLQNLISSQKRIEAIKFFSSILGCSLNISKDVVWKHFGIEGLTIGERKMDNTPNNNTWRLRLAFIMVDKMNNEEKDSFIIHAVSKYIEDNDGEFNNLWEKWAMAKAPIVENSKDYIPGQK